MVQGHLQCIESFLLLCSLISMKKHDWWKFMTYLQRFFILLVTGDQYRISKFGLLLWGVMSRKMSLANLHDSQIMTDNLSELMVDSSQYPTIIFFHAFLLCYFSTTSPTSHYQFFVILCFVYQLFARWNHMIIYPFP